MSELLISEITRMREGFCVIGLERTASGFSSVRPVPWGGRSWIQTQYERADKIAYDFDPMPVTGPHFEDRRAAHPRKIGAVNEIELVRSLKQAEVSAAVTGLFGCPPHPGNSGMYVNPGDAQRSICGCEINAIHFSFYADKIRVALALPSGDTLQDLPVVDRDWCEFADALKDKIGDQPELPARLQDCFNSMIETQVATNPIQFARIGLSREFHGRCWLMLDSLFPLPKTAWLAQFR